MRKGERAKKLREMLIFCGIKEGENANSVKGEAEQLEENEEIMEEYQPCQ